MDFVDMFFEKMIVRTDAINTEIERRRDKQ